MYYRAFRHMRLYSNIGSQKLNSNIYNIGAPAFKLILKTRFYGYRRMRQKAQLYSIYLSKCPIMFRSEYLAFLLLYYLLNINPYAYCVLTDLFMTC